MVGGADGDVVVVEPEVDLVAWFDAELVSHLLGDDDLAFGLDVALPEVTLQLLVDRPGHEPRSNRDQEFLEHARYVAALTEQKVVVLTTDYGMRLRATATSPEDPRSADVDRLPRPRPRSTSAEHHRGRLV